MDYAKNKRIQMLGITFLMILFISMLPIRVVQASGTELKLDGTCITGSVNNSDADYYFKTPANGTVLLGVDNSRLTLALYRDASYSSRIAIGTGGYVDLKAGTYYVRVSGNGSFDISANFSEFTELDKEPNDTMAIALPLTSGKPVMGNAYSAFDDVDWYKLVLTTKSYVNFELGSGNRVLVFDAGGTFVSQIVKQGPIIFDKPGEYYLKVSSNNSYGRYDLKADIVEYPTPNEITKAVYRGSRKVDLTWSKSDYADGYYLFYKTSENGIWQQITAINSGNTTSYTHSAGPSEGQTYYYGVMAFRKCAVYDEIYNQEDAAGFKVTAIKFPTVNNAKAKNVSGKSIQVSWSVSGIANGYRIYRKANGGSFKSVKTITSASTLKWKDTGVKKGTYYTYRIVPYVVSGGENCDGNGAATGSIKLTGTLSKVTGIKVKKEKSRNTVSWKKNSLATGYQVYRKEGSGSYKLVKKTPSVSYRDTKVKKGKKYTYKIKAYYKNYTYNAGKKKYTSKTVTSAYSKTASVKR